MRLFDIKENIRSLYENLINEDGEIDTSVVGEIESLTAKKEEKEENTALYIKELNHSIKALKDEKKSIDERIKIAENQAGWLKSLLEHSLAGQAFESPRVKISYRKSTSVEIKDGFEDYAILNGLEHLLTEKTTITPKKTEISKLLKAGEEVKYCELIEKQNMQIK